MIIKGNRSKGLQPELTQERSRKPSASENQKKPATSVDAPAPRGSKGGKWVAGQSGNPAKRGKIGRPRGSYRVDLRDMCREVAEEAVEALRLALRDKASVVAAANTILAYAYGKPISTTVVRTIRSVEDLTEDELRLLAGETEDNPLMIEGEVAGDDEDQAAG
jgi:hypothetical protein